jgi:hypothetical protein
MNQEQPTPTPNNQPASWDAVVIDLADGPWINRHMVINDALSRDAIGKERYGTRLQPFNGRDSLRDAYEEVLDGAVYLKNVQLEQSWQDWELENAYRLLLATACLIRARLLERDGQ